jgi:hypothetical protein
VGSDAGFVAVDADVVAAEGVAENDVAEFAGEAEERGGCLVEGGTGLD